MRHFDRFSPLARGESEPALVVVGHAVVAAHRVEHVGAHVLAVAAGPAVGRADAQPAESTNSIITAS